MSLIERNRKGFSEIYDLHSDRNWANFWCPLMVTCLTLLNAMPVITSPVITAATPDEVLCLNNGSIAENANETTICNEYFYRFADNWTRSTATSEFHLIGDRSSIILDIKSIGFAGFLTSQFWSGLFADRFGRKAALIAGAIPFAIVPLAVAFFHEKGLIVYSIGMFLMMNGSGNLEIGFQYCVERMAPQYHFLMTCLSFSVASGFGIMMTSVIGYFCNSWIEYLVVIGGYNLLSIGVFALIPKSFRWYFTKNKIEEGKKVLREFCVAAKYEYKEDQIDDILRREEEVRQELRSTSKNVLKYPKLLAVLCRLYVAWFASPMIYYGIMLSPSPKVLLNNFALGVMSSIAGLLIIPLIKHCPQRCKMLPILFALVGVSILAQQSFKNWPKLDILLGALAYSFMCNAFSLLFLYSSEVVPTVIRCSAFGALSGFGRIGSIVGVQVLKLNSPDYPWVSSVVFASAAFLAAFAIFTSPETHGKVLTQTLAEAESQLNSKNTEELNNKKSITDRLLQD